jgi:hypothetical protein
MQSTDLPIPLYNIIHRSILCSRKDQEDLLEKYYEKTAEGTPAMNILFGLCYKETRVAIWSLLLMDDMQRKVETTFNIARILLCREKVFPEQLQDDISKIEFLEINQQDIEQSNIPIYHILIDRHIANDEDEIIQFQKTCKTYRRVKIDFKNYHNESVINVHVHYDNGIMPETSESITNSIYHWCKRNINELSIEYESDNDDDDEEEEEEEEEDTPSDVMQTETDDGEAPCAKAA